MLLRAVSLARSNGLWVFLGAPIRLHTPLLSRLRREGRSRADLPQPPHQIEQSMITQICQPNTGVSHLTCTSLEPHLSFRSHTIALVGLEVGDEVWSTDSESSKSFPRPCSAVLGLPVC